MSKLYREEIVWRRISDVEAVRYTCFQDLRTRRFCVQVADFVRLPPGEADWQARNRIELFIEGQLDACTWCDDLETAIAAHDATFEEHLN